MNTAIVVSVLALVTSVIVTIVALRLAAAEGWKDQASLAVVALTAALYAAFNLPSVVDGAFSQAVVVVATRYQIAVAALHAVAWVRYTRVTLHDRPSWLDGALERLLVIAAVLAVIPGVTFTDRVVAHEIAWMGARYRLVAQTPFGSMLVAGIVAAVAVLALRFARAWRAGCAHTAPISLAFLALFLVAVSDAAASMFVIPAPFLMELGLLLPVAVVAWTSGSRFIADARELSALRLRLEEEVEQRTRELAGAHERLRRSEKLATLGQVAAGVAHEVNNPAAVVLANVDYLRAALRRGELPADAEESLAESSLAARRITGIVHQLLHAGRAAGRASPKALIPLAPLVAEAARSARGAAGHVRVEADVPEWLEALGEEDLFFQVLANLMTNAAQSVPADRVDGRVDVVGRRLPDRVLIEVRDNGTGMAQEVLAKAFEPFFTTKAPGKGSGLGLAISRGLVTSMGGDLRLESALGSGTRAIVELPV